MRLNFFFDVDGTLLPFGKGLPESALEAILDAKSRGHRIFVSTGRSPSEMDKALSPIPFDGGVYSAGCLVIAEGKILEERSYSRKQVEEVLTYLKEMGQLTMIQTSNGTYMPSKAYEFFKESLIKNNGISIKIPGLVVSDSVPEDLDVKKILVLSPSGRVDEVRRDLGDRYNIVDNTVGIRQSDMAEICLMGVDKGSGIKTILSYYGDERISSVGVGDGANDIEMIEYAGLGIAMGNADECLKVKADWISTDANQDGIRNAIEYAEKVYHNKCKSYTQKPAKALQGGVERLLEITYFNQRLI